MDLKTNNLTRTEPNDLSGEVKKSLRNIQTKTPETIAIKSEAVGQLHLIEPTRQQLMTIFEHLQTIGAEEAMLTDSKQINRSILSKWFQQLVLRNDSFPHDLPIKFVLSEFFEAIWQGRVQRDGNNLSTHIKAFRIWIGGYEQTIRSKYYHRQNPSNRKKELPEFTAEYDESSTGERKKTLKRMYGDNIPDHLKKYAE